MTGAEPVTAREGVTAVAIDFGGVLIDWDPARFYRGRGLSEELVSCLLAEVFTPSWIASVDIGAVPLATAVQELAAVHPRHRATIEAWLDLVANPTVRGEVVELVGRLREEGVCCYGITNMSLDLFEAVTARCGFVHLLSGVVVSAAERLLKPDPAIFMLLLRRFRLRPRHVLVVDDNPTNLATATALGMPTHHFTTANALKADLIHGHLLRKDGTS